VFGLLLSSGEALNDVATSTLEKPGPSTSRADAADRRRAVDPSPPRARRTPVFSSLQRQPGSGSIRRGVGILHDEEDVFVVGAPGGTFQSTTNPDVSVYIPPSAVSRPVTLTMQVIIVTGQSDAMRCDHLRVFRDGHETLKPETETRRL